VQDLKADWTAMDNACSPPRQVALRTDFGAYTARGR
jgi:hypothetical protein